MVLKKRLITILNDFLEPIRVRRQNAKNRPFVLDTLFEGTNVVREVAQQTMGEVRQAMKINYETLL